MPKSHSIYNITRQTYNIIEMQSLSLRNLVQQRKIVIHHTHLLPNDCHSWLKPQDLLFFDDCLFSQWIWLKKNLKFIAQNNIDCILGFSSGLYATEDAKQLEKVESHVLHDACNDAIRCVEDADKLRNSLPEMNGFMKVSQLKQLLELPFCHLALHGCCHLNLQNEKNLLKKIQMFKHDLDSGCKRLNELSLVTSTYVYPYVYSFATSDSMVRHYGFSQVVGGSADKIFRIAIEDLVAGRSSECCS